MANENDKDAVAVAVGAECEAESETDMQDLLTTAFGSSVNLGGGGGVQVETEEDSGKPWKRTRQNAALCAFGAVAGGGMFAEAYYVMAWGNIKPVLASAYPSCFSHTSPLFHNVTTANGTVVLEQYPLCSYNLTNSIGYITFASIMLGMVSFGFFADKLGRRLGSILTAAVMFVGAALTAAAYAGPDNWNSLFVMMAVMVAFTNYGVGGEYPLASASAAERAELMKREGKHTRAHVRGKAVVMTFAMQGWGNLVNTLMILLVLLGQGCTAGKTCSFDSLNLTWRLQYALGAAFLFCLFVGRVSLLKESVMWKENKEKRVVETQLRSDAGITQRKINTMAVRAYWHRMVGTALGWLIWDIVFYGNKMFQATIIQAITGSKDNFTTMLYTLLNAAVSLVGYYVAAMTIDKPWMGRVRMQNMGFAMLMVIFFFCAIFYTQLAKNEPKLFLFLYLLSSFFMQFGPNATTWLLPSEVFPTDIRSLSHGISTLLFSYGGPNGTAMDTQSIFWVCFACGFAGLAVTALFVPDVTALDLQSIDDQWDDLLHSKTYHGPARNPKFLSLWERKTSRCSCECCLSETRQVRPAKVLVDAPQHDLSAA
jgi:MFS family permease